MGRFAIRPRRYHDQLDAIEDKILNYLEAGHTIDRGLNPNSVYSLLQFAHEEITRLRELAGVPKPERKSRLITGPRPVAESKPVKAEEE